MSRASMGLTLCACLLLAGCAGGPGSEIFADEGRLGPGGFFEANLDMDEGATIDVSFEAGAPMTWDIHSHDGNRVIFHEQGTNTSAHIAFTAERPGGYSVLFTNEGNASADLNVVITGEARLRSTAP